MQRTFTATITTEMFDGIEADRDERLEIVKHLIDTGTLTENAYTTISVIEEQPPAA